MSQPTWKSGSSVSSAPLSTNRIQQKVKQILRELNITEPPVPIEKVTTSLGLEIIAEPFDGDISGALLQSRNKAIIGVNDRHHPNRQRFSIAHEIGHFVLHKLEGPHFDRRSYCEVQDLRWPLIRSRSKPIALLPSC